MGIYIKSIAGHVRENNQDYVASYQNETGELLLVLCDGMGGHRAGEVASRYTAKTLGETFEETTSIADDAENWLRSEIETIDRTIYKQSLENKKYEGMGTTLVALYINEKNWVVANVGDSRFYQLQGEELNQVSLDHTFVQELYRQGKVATADVAKHPKRNLLTQSIGGKDAAMPDLFSGQRRPDDFFILMSDGLYEELSDDQMKDIIINESSLEAIAEKLVAESLTGQARDNISFVLFNGKEV